MGLRGFLVCGLLLAGCSGGGSGLVSTAATRGSPSIQVLSKAFTIEGPRGFCVDEDATRETDTGTFVMLGGCAAISGNRRDAKPTTPAMLTASVTPAEAPLDNAGLDRLARFFSTPEGQDALARGDGASDVGVLDISRSEGLVLVHAQDGTQQGDTTGDYWRGVFSTAAHLVTITVSGFRAAPLDEKTGAALARDFVKAIRRANSTEPAGAQGAGNTGLASFFNRLL
jgi:hypothetical protein